MDRNKLLYFIVGGVLVTFGYVTRVMQVENYYRSSTILIVMGLFFIFALMFKKANEIIAQQRDGRDADISILENRIAELKKENAELDMKRKAERQIFQGIVEKKNEQLTKAKEIIRTFLNMPMPNNEEVFADVGMFLTKAEQFLKEIEK